MATSAQIGEAQKWARKELIETLVQTVYYVGLGYVKKREMMEKFGLTDEQAERGLAILVESLTKDVRKL